MDKVNNISYASSQSLGDRPNQQDAYLTLTKNNDTLAVICDGMGGLEGGQYASETVVSLFLNNFMNEEIDDIPTFLLKQVVDGDNSVARLTNDMGEYLDAGSTCVGAYVRDNMLYYISVGDSHIYILRKGDMLQLNTDYNYKYLLDQKLMNKEIDEDTYQQELVRGEALISYLGMDGLDYVGRNDFGLRLEDGDQILLCSDGLYKRLETSTIQSTIKTEKSLQDKVNLLQEEARKASDAHNQDNTTIILMEYKIHE